jgi:hypothetical protein
MLRLLRDGIDRSKDLYVGQFLISPLGGKCNPRGEVGPQGRLFPRRREVIPWGHGGEDPLFALRFSKQ